MSNNLAYDKSLVQAISKNHFLVYILSQALENFVLYDVCKDAVDASDKVETLAKAGIKAWAVQQTSADVLETAKGLQESVNTFVDKWSQP